VSATSGSMSDRFETLDAREREAKRILFVALDGPQRLVCSTHVLIGEVAMRIYQREENKRRFAARVCIQLLSRASNDLRCASGVVDYGYPAQAATICGSMYEAALAAAYIGGDEDLAREWLRHDDPTKNFRPTWELAAVIGNGDEEITKDVYSVYRSLCVPKHVNPLAASRMGVEMIEGVPFLRNGPDTSEFALYVSWDALVEGCRAVASALAYVAAALLDVPDRDALTPMIAGVLEHCRQLREAIARWGERNA
jgi:hypothetical protein